MSTQPATRATARLGLRERKKLATREAIGAAAFGLAVRRGLENMTVEDIAAAANVSPRTVNNYFSSKLEAISARGIDRAVKIGSALCERPPSEPLWEAITAAVLEHYDMVQSPRGEYLKTSAAMQQALAAAIAERAGLDPDRDMLPVVLAGAVTTASQAAVRRWFAADPPAPLRPLVREALGQLATAFTDAARAVQPG